MKLALRGAVIVIALIICAGSLWAKSTNHAKSPKSGKARVNAALMLSGGESARCQLGNINDAYVVAVTSSANPSVSRFVSGVGAGSCVVLPITLKTGTQIQITGVLQDTASISGGIAQAPFDPATSISESCFNVEAYAVGLAADSGSEYDPQDPSNVINTQGFGFLWYDSDNNLKPGPYTYSVAGCSGVNCPVSVSYYNTDSSSGGGCTVLESFPAVSQSLN
jgi:hypothetical protein